MSTRKGPRLPAEYYQEIKTLRASWRTIFEAASFINVFTLLVRACTVLRTLNVHLFIYRLAHCCPYDCFHHRFAPFSFPVTNRIQFPSKGVNSDLACLPSSSFGDCFRSEDLSSPVVTIFNSSYALLEL